MADISEFDDALRASEAWVADLKLRLGWQHADRVYLALVATLHALRDHLPTGEAVRLGAALPALLRGFYFEGWHPRSRPVQRLDREAFLARIHEGVHRDPGVDPEAAARAVFALLAERMTGADIEEIKDGGPAQLHGLWPD
jgi:uncharacterized protein (DUF2267 family)